MRTRRILASTVLLGLALVLLWPVRAGEPRYFAIRDARIVTVSGPVIEGGTVVVANGLIAAVGKDIAIPAEALVMDGRGLTVYPGLIDTLSELGLPSAAPAPGGGPGGGAAAAAAAATQRISRGPEDRPASTPWVNAADEFRADERRIETWRNAGVTSVLVTPRSGIFPGEGALLNLGVGRPGEMVVKAPANLQVAFATGGGGGGGLFSGFPSSLMGVLSYVKQVYLDAGQYAVAQAAYSANPRGRERPDYDRVVRVLEEAQRSGWPVYLPANTPPQITRTIGLAQELKLNAVLYGIQEGYAAAPAIAASKIPVLVSLKWPEKNREGDPDADEPLRVLRVRDRAPSTPAALQKAGVKFAFYSDGITAPRDLFRNVRKAIDAGLAADAAVRAFTLSAAEILGVADRLGSVEQGKIANLIVTEGDLFAEKTKVKWVFVDGARFEVHETPPRPGEGQTTARETPATPSSTAPPGSQVVMPLPSANTVIQNATILTVTKGTIEKGAILIRGGKIAAVGKNISVPQGATVIDAAGMYVSPGIIDCHSHIAIEGNVNEGSISVSSMAAIADVLDPEDVDIYRDLAGGVTTANVLHGSANPIGGLNAVIKLRWGQDAKGLLFAGAMPGIKFALGENPKRSNFAPPPGVPPRYPATRMGVMDVIRQAFVEAREYKKQWDAYNRRKAAGEANLAPPRRDLKLEPLVEVLEGKRYVHAHSYRADEILQLLLLADEFGFKVRTLQHVLEGYKVAKEIAAHGTGASTFSDWWAYKVEAYDAIPYNAAIMTQYGVVVSLNSDSAEEARHLNQEAGKMMKWGGMSETDALKLVTINPAIQLGIQDRVGSIEVGKDADLVIFDKHPLSAFAVPQKVFIDGVMYFDRQKDLAQRPELAAEKKALMEKEKKAEPPRRDPERRSDERRNPPQTMPVSNEPEVR